MKLLRTSQSSLQKLGWQAERAIAALYLKMKRTVATSKLLTLYQFSYYTNFCRKLGVLIDRSLQCASVSDAGKIPERNQTLRGHLMTLARNHNHPKKGSSIKVEPIRDLAAIRGIKDLLADRPRDLSLFTFGINTAYRAGEILSLRVGQVDHLREGDRLEIKQSKTGKYRAATLNCAVIETLQAWLSNHPRLDPQAPVFYSQRTKRSLTVSTVNGMVKRWCREQGLRGNFGSHSMRKTWGYHQRVQGNQPIPLLMAAFGHSSQAQTLEYLCIQDDEIRELYGMVL